MKTFLLAILLILQAPSPQSPQQLVEQLQTLLQQLKTALPPAEVTVADGTALTTALTTGGPIKLAPATTFTGNFTVGKATTLIGDRTSLLVPADKFTPPLTVTASDVTLRGFTVRNGAPDRETVVVGDVNATTAAAQPSRVTLDSLSIEAGLTGGHRAISLHGAFLTVTNSRVTGYWEAGRDSQAIWIHDGPGPYTVTDNYLEASGEIILTGGASLKIPNVVPTDVVIARNIGYKPDTWRTNGSTVKNCIEIKNGRRVLIEGNTCDGNWKSGQDGNPIVLTVRNQNNDSPWVIVDEVTVRGNETRRCPDGFAVAILGFDNNYPSQQTHTITIEHNLFRDATNGFNIGNGVTDALIIRNNTLPAITNDLLKFSDTRPTIVKSALTFTANAALSGQYGAAGSNMVVGLPSLQGYTTIVDFTGNVIEKTAARAIAWPAGNTLVEPGALAALLDPKTFKLKTGTAGY